MSDLRRAARSGLLALLLALATSAFAQAPAIAPDDPILTQEPLYSQHKEELIVRHFFGDRREGVYLDVGAFHWKRWSTTYYLEKHLGWTGVAVDPLPEVAEGWRRNRPGARFFPLAASDRSGETMTFYAAGGLSSTDPEHLTKFGTPEVVPGELRVETITLDDLLERAGIERIDFLSMDIEGGEPAALAGFDIARFQPQLVCIEATERIREAITAYFDAHGYRRIDAYLAWDEVNWYFAPAEGAAAAGRTSTLQAWKVPLIAGGVALIVVGSLWVARREHHA